MKYNGEIPISLNVGEYWSHIKQGHNSSNKGVFREQEWIPPPFINSFDKSLSLTQIHLLTLRC